jgi:ganglioside-induced differentiation-associated protein 1
MVERRMSADNKPRLYHNPASYYSMIARLALAEAGIAYVRVFVDIHRRMEQQRPEYVRLNPNMTIPTLVLPDRILDQSREIAEYAFGAEAAANTDARQWVDLHYSFPIEELTFGRILSRNPIVRRLIPARLASTSRKLLALAVANPDLAALYRARAEVFAERARTFDPDNVQRLARRRMDEAFDFLDRLDKNFADSRKFIVPPAYGIADAVWSVFLARIEFAGLGAEIPKRLALARYWNAMQARPAFAAADIWTRMHMVRFVAGMAGFV